MKLIDNAWPMIPKLARYLDLDSRQLGNNLTGGCFRLLAEACSKAESRYLDLAVHILGLELHSSQSCTTLGRLNITMCRIDICSILDVNMCVKRSRCGGKPWSLGLVVFSIWITLATSLLEAGSCGSVDTENGLRAKGVS